MKLVKMSTMRLLVLLFCVLVFASAAGPRARRPRPLNGRRLGRAQRRRSQTMPVPPALIPRTSSASVVPSLCPDRLSLEEREEMANLVFTGRIESIVDGRNLVSRHTVGSKGVAGGVKIKRVFKGPANLLAGRVVQVRGLGRWDVCNSLARVRDTKIFLTNMDREGGIHLNSSLVRLTLKNLRATTKAVSDVPYEDRTPIEEEPCEKQLCTWGSDCVTDQNGEAICICASHCPPPSSTASPVCGTDGKTYDTMCELRRHACSSSQQNTRIKHSGRCDVPARDEGEDDGGTVARHRGASQDPTGPTYFSPPTDPPSSTTTITTTATTTPTGGTTNTITGTD